MIFCASSYIILKSFADCDESPRDPRGGNDPRRLLVMKGERIRAGKSTDNNTASTGMIQETSGSLPILHVDKLLQG